MDISLRPELEAFVTEQMNTGQYSNVSDVVNEALALLQLHRLHDPLDDMSPEELDEIRREIQIGIDELDRGEGEPWDVNQIKAECRRRWAERQKQT